MHWGTITWIFFHTMAEKIKDDKFEIGRSFLLNTIVTLCHNLPCPDCRQHAIRTLQAHPIGVVTTKEQLKSSLHSFHNSVNLHRRKKTYDVSVLEKYKTASLRKAYSILTTVFQTSSHRLMLDQMARKQMFVDLTREMNKNAGLFDL